jgi:transcriptional regulator with XRE-family HTH domain
MMNSHLLPPSDDPGFPAALAAARQACGFSAAELARLAGISPTMVARYENVTRADHHRPRPDTVVRLERVLRNKTAGRFASAAAAPALDEASLETLLDELERRGFAVTLAKAAPPASRGA